MSLRLSWLGGSDTGLAFVRGVPPLPVTPSLVLGAIVCLCLVRADSQIGFLWEGTQITPIWTRGATRDQHPQGSSFSWFPISILFLSERETGGSIRRERGIHKRERKKRKKTCQGMMTFDLTLSESSIWSFSFLNWHWSSLCKSSESRGDIGINPQVSFSSCVRFVWIFFGLSVFLTPGYPPFACLTFL